MKKNIFKTLLFILSLLQVQCNRDNEKSVMIHQIKNQTQDKIIVNLYADNKMKKEIESLHGHKLNDFYEVESNSITIISEIPFLYYNTIPFEHYDSIIVSNSSKKYIFYQINYWEYYEETPICEYSDDNNNHYISLIITDEILETRDSMYRNGIW